MDNARVSVQAVVERLRSAHLLLEILGPLDLAVSGVAQDSRRVSPGDLFLAWRGLEHDAHDFLPQAVAAGAPAAVVEHFSPGVAATQIRVRDGRLAAALAADTVLGSPWRNLFLGGVTGTNGKTTTAILSRHLLQGRAPSGALGTLGLVESSGRVRPGTEGLTTPGPVEISTWLRELADEGAGCVVLEASSHALDQHRLDGLRFDAAVFTTFGRDHLDYHPDEEHYRQAKARLLDLLKPQGWAVINRGEEAWASLPAPAGRTLLFGLEEDGREKGGPAPGPAPALLARGVELLPRGSRFRLAAGAEEALVDLPLLGRFNVENALAASGVARVAGLGLDEIAAGLTSAPQIPGRLEVVVRDPFPVLIDFAHTPDALETVLGTLRPLVQGRLLVLFGAGGDRDRGKRPRMGEVVGRMADLAFVTSDNPRTEDPETIIDEIVAGMAGAPFRRSRDRREAIAAALGEARPGDMVLLAGKGHESYQIVGRERRPFPEAAIVRELLGVGEGVGA